MIFGKIPAHGDFVCRGMAAGEQAEFDQALSASIHAAQERFGEGYREAFLCTPPWRCVTPAEGGFLGGAIAPSMDRAERLFPLFLARRCNSRAEAGGYAQACEDLLFRAIPELWPVDRLMTEAEELEAAGSPDAAEPEDGWWLDGGDSLPEPTPRLSGMVPPRLIEEMMAVTGQMA